jgi:hypothetical protein
MKFQSNIAKAKEAKEAKEATFRTAGLKEIVITALLTAVLTLTSSYFLIFSQLDMEHDYWKKRTQSERLTSLLDRRIEVMEGINKDILIFEILAENFKMYSIDFITNTKLLELEKKATREMIKDGGIERRAFQKKSEEITKHIYILASKLQMAEMYFDNNVDELIRPLSAAIEKNYSHNLALSSTIDQLDADSLEKLLKKDRKSIEVLKIQRLKIIKAMRIEIDSITKLLFGFGRNEEHI